MGRDRYERLVRRHAAQLSVICQLYDLVTAHVEALLVVVKSTLVVVLLDSDGPLGCDELLGGTVDLGIAGLLGLSLSLD